MAWRGGFDGKLYSKDEFTTYVAGLKWGAWRPAFLTLHNTGAPTLKQWMATKGGESQRIKNLANFYQHVQGWSAGPHLFVSPTGIFLGTPLTVPGVHTPSWNGIAWGMEMAGDFDAEPFDPQLLDNAVHAIAVLYSALGRAPETLRLHKEDARTTHKHCPGKNVNKADMIKRIGDAMAALHPGSHQHGAAA